MRIGLTGAAALAAFVGGCSTDRAGGGMVVAAATLHDAEGRGVGTATVTPGRGGLRVRVTAMGLPPGTHGIHLHTLGNCDGAGFAGTGGHWNPTAMHHGAKNPAGPHEGDLPNLVIGADGRGALSFTIRRAAMSGDKGLLDADGASIVIHAGTDDLMSDPAGNSGAKIACGVLS